MALIDKSEQEQERERRVAALRELAQGPGINFHGVEGDFEKFIAAIGGIAREDGPAFIDALESSIPEGNVFIDAFSNALFAKSSGENLTKRREKFLSKNPNLSARTLMRYEIEGANLLVRHIEIALEALERQREYEESEDAARDLDIAVLRERISKLESTVDDLKELIALLAKGTQLEATDQYKWLMDLKLPRPARPRPVAG